MGRAVLARLGELLAFLHTRVPLRHFGEVTIAAAAAAAAKAPAVAASETPLRAAFPGTRLAGGGIEAAPTPASHAASTSAGSAARPSSSSGAMATPQSDDGFATPIAASSGSDAVGGGLPARTPYFTPPASPASLALTGSALGAAAATAAASHITMRRGRNRHSKEPPAPAGGEHESDGEAVLAGEPLPDGSPLRRLDTFAQVLAAAAATSGDAKR